MYDHLEDAFFTIKSFPVTFQIPDCTYLSSDHHQVEKLLLDRSRLVVILEVANIVVQSWMPLAWDCRDCGATSDALNMRSMSWSSSSCSDSMFVSSAIYSTCRASSWTCTYSSYSSSVKFFVVSTCIYVFFSISVPHPSSCSYFYLSSLSLLLSSCSYFIFFSVPCNFLSVSSNIFFSLFLYSTLL